MIHTDGMHGVYLFAKKPAEENFSSLDCLGLFSMFALFPNNVSFDFH